MLRHLPTCSARKEYWEKKRVKRECGCYEVLICGKYNKNYWLIIEISENATLRDLDQFIRDIWVEYCGHLSAFEIKRTRYEVDPDPDIPWGIPAKSMEYKVKDVFAVGDTFGYEYDFGSETELILTVRRRYISKWRREKITILSRNNPLEILCSQCGKNKAEWVDPEGFYTKKPFWCRECLETRFGQETEENDDMPLLPVCNSPRMGVCGYVGSEIYPDQFVPDREWMEEQTENGKEKA